MEGPAVSMDDTELAAAIGAGDREAEEDLVRRFQAGIRCIVQQRLHWGPDCDDLTSEILQAVIASLRTGTFRGDCQLGTFIHTIAKNKITDFLRRRRPEAAELHEEIPDPAPGPDETVIRDETARSVRACLSRLKPKYRSVIYLYYYEGLSVAEIAQELGLKPRKVSEWKDYGLKLVRQHLLAAP